MYSYTKANVITQRVQTDKFEIMHCCMLVSFRGKLFIIVLDSALCRAVEGRKEELGLTLASPQGPVGTPKKP